MFTGGTPVLFTVAPFSIHRLRVTKPLAVGSRIGPPVCLMSVVTTTFVPSHVWRLSWYGATFFTRSDGFWYGP